MMIISDQASGPCDQCDKGEATIGALAQGATGRVCEVLWFCADCVDATKAVPAQQVRDNMAQHFGAGAWAEF